MASKKERARARERNQVLTNRIQLMGGLAAAVAVFGLTALAKLPHGFDSLAAGQGKKPLDNRRVQIVLALLIYCLIVSNNIRVRLWAIPLVALLALAVSQHKATYEGGGDPTVMEVF